MIYLSSKHTIILNFRKSKVTIQEYEKTCLKTEKRLQYSYDSGRRTRIASRAEALAGASTQPARADQEAKPADRLAHSPSGRPASASVEKQSYESSASIVGSLQAAAQESAQKEWEESRRPARSSGTDA